MDNGNRTPLLRLYYETSQLRNTNWSQLDDMIGNAFQPGSPIQLPPGYANPPTTGLVYGRGGTSIPSIAWRPVLPLAGGAMAGDIVLARDPTTAMMAVTKQYVDAVFSTTGVYRGDWQVAANNPDLNALVPAPAPGDRWMALTVDPNVPEFPPAGIPGIDPAVRISQGTWVQRNATNDAWFIVIGGQLTKFEADQYYVNVTGDTMSGGLVISMNAPLLTIHETNLINPALGGMRWIRSDFTAGWVFANDTPGRRLLIERHDLLGALVDIPFQIDEVTGIAAFASIPTAVGIPLTQDCPIDTVLYLRQDRGWVGALAALDPIYVNTSGDTMTGALILFADPTQALEATTKQYVDAADALLELEKVNRAGDTMTGALYLFADPTQPLEAAPKQYVDAGLLLKVNRAGDTMTGFLTLSADPTAPLHAATKQYTDAGDLLLQTDINTRVLRAGDTMGGFLTLSADPTALLHATTKQYTDAGDLLRVLKAGDTMTGDLFLPATTPTQNLHAATKVYVDTAIAATVLYRGAWQVQPNIPDLTPIGTTFPLNGWSWIAKTLDPNIPEIAPAGLPGISGLSIDSGDRVIWNAGSAIYDLVKGSSLSIAEANVMFVNVTGDTMTGPLLLNADPTAVLGATTKQYTDAADLLRVLKAGDTMTGALTLPATTPTQNLHAATKLYVDAQVAAANLYQGTWQVAANVPDLNVPPNAPLNGYSWIAVTADPQVAEIAPATLPGIGGATIYNGDLIKWNNILLQYEQIQGSSISRAQADSLYLQLVGGTVTGSITLPGDPTLALEAATKSYVDTVAANAVGAYLPLIGGTTTGSIYVPISPNPAVGNELAHKQYVDETVASNSLYQGIWNVASNTPDLSVPPLVPLNGYSWICQTVDPAVPESPPIALPGIPVTTVIDSGWTIRWNGNTNVYELIRGPSLSLAAAQGYFVDITGDQMTGDLSIAKVTPKLRLETPVGNFAGIEFWRNDLATTPTRHIRWHVNMNSGAEGGANAGSDFRVDRFTDAGAYIESAVQVSRATGYVNIPKDIECYDLLLRHGVAGTTGAVASTGTQIRMGYNNQAGATYGHEIRTCHHGSQTNSNQIQFWLWQQTDTPSSAAPSNNVLNLKGDRVEAKLLLTAPGATFTDNVLLAGQNLGINFTGGARIYAWTDKAIRICEGTNGLQPQCADSGGLNARDIIDTVNGDARYMRLGAGGFLPLAGGTMTGQLLAASGLNTGIGIGDTWHGWDWDNTYNGEVLKSYQGKFGFHLTNGSVPGTLMVQIDNSAVWALGGRSFNNRTNSTTSGQTFNVHLIQDSSGVSLAEHKVLQYRGTGQWETELQFITSTNNGLNFWYKSWGGNAGAAQFYIYGQCSVGSLANRSDRKLKTKLEALQADDTVRAFAKLKPMRYERLGPTHDANGNPTIVPGTPEIGLVAQDVAEADPTLVSTDGDGVLAYSVTGVLALVVARVQALEAEIARLREDHA